MLSIVKPALERDDPRPDRAGDLLGAMGLTPGLPEALSQNDLGRQFEPVQLNIQTDLVAQFAHLLRPEPLGGAEPQIYENGRRIEAQAELQLHRALASIVASPRSFLNELLEAARERKDALEADYAGIDDAYARLQARLRKWQKRTEQRSNGAGALWRWLLGGGDQLSVVEAAMLWNEREVLALRRAALQAAVAIAGRLVEQIAQLLAQLDAQLAGARQARAQIAHERAQLAQAPASYAPWTHRVEPRAVVSALRARAELDRLLAAILRRLAEPGEAELGDIVRAQARQAAEELLAPLDIAALIELDAGDAAPDSDPLVPVGKELLDDAQRAPWQLARGARPRTETLQLTADGTPVFTLDGLRSAAMGGDAWRMGFLEVRLAVAREDLALSRDGDDAFQATLCQRNLYVLEDLALAWEANHTPPPASQNGQHDEPVGELDR